MSPRRLLTFATGLSLLAGAFVLLTRRLGPLPPLGPLLDPGGGVWAAARAAERSASESLSLPSLERDAEVVYDDRGVPHIYAGSELDAYRVLGFVVARDRLFQLELQTRAASGRLTEWFGRQALELDQEARRLGLGRLADQRLAQSDSAGPAFRALEAYAEGVNAWLDRMAPGDVPLEYRLIGRRPDRWEVRNSFLLFGRMARDLAWNDPSLLKARAAALVGARAADALFPINDPIQEPIQPNPVDGPRFTFAPVPPPGPPDSGMLALGATLDAARRQLGSVRWGEEEVVLGSNNWAVAPARTAAGAALLAGDPHLGLTLPSIWYQAHVVVPGKLDVAGATLPGAPGVIIGFNRSIAWSLTNTGSDVNDFYRERVDDRGHPARYWLDGDWRPVEQRTETFLGPDGKVLAVDTTRFTHRGPLIEVDSSWLSVAWTAYLPHADGKEFLEANRARTAGEFLEAMAGYVAPAQNMLVADRRGTIAIRSTGTYPVRPGDGRGDVVRDGTTRAEDWTGDLPLDLYPFGLNPARGFLSSANQQPVDPARNGRYLGADWPSPWRAIRINQLLREDSAVTPETMRRMQTDNRSAFADAVLPVMLAVSTLGDSSAERARQLLAEWDRRYGLDSRDAVLFDAVARELQRQLWDELRGPGRAGGLRPSDGVLLGLLADAGSIWWDRRDTPGREGRDEVIRSALAAGFDSTVARYGPRGPAWEWGTVHQANIYHPMRLPALSALQLPVAWGTGTVSPSSGSGTHGASWRMVVELADPVRAWAVYPGGQSGNPVSRHYRDLVPRWQAGQLDSLVVPEDPAGFPAPAVESRLRLRGGSRR